MNTTIVIKRHYLWGQVTIQRAMVIHEAKQKYLGKEIDAIALFKLAQVIELEGGLFREANQLRAFLRPRVWAGNFKKLNRQNYSYE